MSAVVDLEEHQAAIRAERDGLLVERGLASLDAIDGADDARARVEEIGARVAVLDSELALIELAREERERRAQEAAAAAQQAEQAAQAAESERLTVQRDEAVDDVLRAAVALARCFHSVTQVDAEVQALAGRGSSAWAGITEALGERLLIELQDAGLRPEGPILAGRRKQLLEAWPRPPQRGRRPCTVCEHDDRAEIDAAMVAGSPPLTEIATSSGLSESALKRHRLNHLAAAVAA